MSDYDEIQEEKPEIALKVNRVGIEGVRKRIVTYSPKGELQFDTTLSAYVDLPREQRGVHMSRNVEVFNEAIEKAREKKVATLENVLSEISRNLLEKHDYATRAEVIAKTNFYFEEDFSGKKTNQAAEVTMTIETDENGKDRRKVAVTMPGMTLCPCAQLTFHEEENIPLSYSPSHSQRAMITIEVETSGKFVRLEHLIEAARKAFSAPSVGLLKREDEYKLIKQAFERPRFIEDLVRHALYNTYQTLIKEGYPDDVILRVNAESLESIHPYNIYAHRSATLKQLKEEEQEKKKKSKNSET